MKANSQDQSKRFMSREKRPGTAGGDAPAYPRKAEKQPQTSRGKAEHRQNEGHYSSGQSRQHGPSGKDRNGRESFRKSAPRPHGTDRRPMHDRPSGQGKARGPEMEGLAARRTALSVIRKVTEDGAYASLTLDAALRGSGLGAADRRLVTRLVYDTLDHLIYLDYVLSQVMAREDTDIKLRNILRLGACQILLEDRIPESAATNTSVQLCVELGMEGLKGVCNGILRNLLRKREELVFPDPDQEPDLAMSVRLSVPEWLWRRLRDAYGAAEAEAMLRYRSAEEQMTLRMNLLQETDTSFQQALQKKVWKQEPGLLPHTWRISGAMDIARDADFLRGAFSIQSESSMMAVLALSPARGQRMLDCCAAPGGKACFAAELMGGTGRVQAWDLHPHRVALIEAQAKRLGLENVRPIERDATRFREDLVGSMDRVLLDAPCSGLGVMAEKPDIKLRVSEQSVEELTELQARLLDTVCRYVRPGGIMVYSTCSLLREENEDQIRAFLERHPEFRMDPLPAAVPERFREHEKLGLQLLPHRDHVEGFYICRMIRREDL